MEPSGHAKERRALMLYEEPHQTLINPLCLCLQQHRKRVPRRHTCSIDSKLFGQCCQFKVHMYVHIFENTEKTVLIFKQTLI